MEAAVEEELGVGWQAVPFLRQSYRRSISLFDLVWQFGRSLPGRSSLFSRFGAAFQAPPVCVPTCQVFTFALAHVHFQLVSNPTAFSHIQRLQAEDEIVI